MTIEFPLRKLFVMNILPANKRTAVIAALVEGNSIRATLRMTGVAKNTLTKLLCDPDIKHISTSFVERQNLTMRMHMRRFTRLTNAFSKKVENLRHAVALHFMFYNFCRVHQPLRVTPAMEAGLADHVWSLKELVGLLGEQKATLVA